MTSRKAKGDAGEAAYAKECEARGAFVLPLSPSLPVCDLAILWPDGTLELSEVKAWRRSLPPGVIGDVEQGMLDGRDMLPAIWRRRLRLSLVHAVKGDDGEWRFAETWRFP